MSCRQSTQQYSRIDSLGSKDEGRFNRPRTFWRCSQKESRPEWKTKIVGAFQLFRKFKMDGLASGLGTPILIQNDLPLSKNWEIDNHCPEFRGYFETDQKPMTP
jgi:hypothetical protein